MSNNVIVPLHDGNVLAADSVVKDSLTTGIDVKFGKISTCKEFLQVQSLLWPEGKK